MSLLPYRHFSLFLLLLLLHAHPQHHQSIVVRNEACPGQNLISQMHSVQCVCVCLCLCLCACVYVYMDVCMDVAPCAIWSAMKINHHHSLQLGTKEKRGKKDFSCVQM